MLRKYVLLFYHNKSFFGGFVCIFLHCLALTELTPNVFVISVAGNLQQGDSTVVGSPKVEYVLYDITYIHQCIIIFRAKKAGHPLQYFHILIAFIQFHIKLILIVYFSHWYE